MASAGASRDRVWSGVAVGEGVGRGVGALVDGEFLKELEVGVGTLRLGVRVVAVHCASRRGFEWGAWFNLNFYCCYYF